VSRGRLRRTCGLALELFGGCLSWGWRFGRHNDPAFDGFGAKNPSRFSRNRFDFDTRARKSLDLRKQKAASAVLYGERDKECPMKSGGSLCE
jgi:hypothetical protein